MITEHFASDLCWKLIDVYLFIVVPAFFLGWLVRGMVRSPSKETNP